MAIHPRFDLGPTNEFQVYYSSTTIPGTGEGSYQAGDRLIYTGAAAGKPFQWICTTGGAPGTAVWRSVPLYVVQLGVAAGAAAADYDGQGFTVPAGMDLELIQASERHQTAGSDASAELDVMKVASGAAKAAGTTMLASPFQMDSTADTNVTATLTATVANRRVTAGDSVILLGLGTLTAADGVIVTLTFTML